MKYISQNNSTGANKGNNKRCFSANGFSLLPLALRPCLFLCFAIATIVTFNIWFSNDTFATNSTISVNVTQNTASLEIKPINTTGTFAKTDTNNAGITFSVTTNNFSGYSLSIAASNDTTDAANLTQTVVKNEGTENEESTTYRIESLGEVEGMTSSGISESVFSNSSNTQYNNKWGIRPNKLNSVDNTNYLPIPTSTSDSTTLDITSISGANNYTIDMGARVDTDIPMGTYSNTLLITAVANLINYEITYNKGNTEDTVTNLPANQTGVIDDPTTNSTNITLSGTRPTRTGYIFNGWCTELPTVGTNGDPDACGSTTYAASGTYDLNATLNPNVTLYAIWQEVYSITFTAGNNINTMMIADSSEKWKPYYINTGNSKTFNNVPKDRKYIVTVIPEANYKLDSWTSSNNTTERLTNDILLTTNYISGATSETLTANGVSGTYASMKDFALGSCTMTGNNVTDERDGKSYTVAKFTSNGNDYCYMLSNLRLDNTTDGTTQRILTSADSDVTPNATYTEFPMPMEVWTSNTQDYFCKAIMKNYKQGSINEYYYNWYAAKANPYQCADPTTATNATATNDGLSLGSICPKGWVLPTYKEDVLPSILWGGGDNIGMLTTLGIVYSGFSVYFGNSGGYWSKSRDAVISYSFELSFTGSSAILGGRGRKSYGKPVRCMRSS